MITFSRSESVPPDDPPTLLMNTALVPMLVWRDVPVLHAEPADLNPLELFLLEAVELTNGVTSAALEEITGLPMIVWSAIARRLGALRLLADKDDVFGPSSRTRDAVESGTATRLREGTLDFLFLPHTNDLLVASGLKELEQAKVPATSVAPLPPALHHRSQRQLLSERIQDRTVANLPSTVVGLSESISEDENIGVSTKTVPTCPAFRCSATVTFGNGVTNVVLQLSGGGKRGRKRKGGSGKDSAPVTLELAKAEGLVREWLHVAARVGDPQYRAEVWSAISGEEPRTLVSVQHDGPARWWVPLRDSDAEKLAERGLLTDPVGLCIHDDETEALIKIRYRPADRAAEQLFTVDLVVQTLLAMPNNVIDTVAEMDYEDILRVRARVWQLGHHWIVHALRESEDFDYA